MVQPFRSYCNLVATWPRLFAGFVAVVTCGLTALSILTMEPNYVNTEDPTKGFIPKGTKIIGREMMKNKVDRGWYYDWEHKYFYDSPKQAKKRDVPPSYRRNLREDHGPARMLRDLETDDDLNALKEKRKGTDIACPRLTVDGDEHITLLFVYVDGDNGPLDKPSDVSNFGKSVITAEAMRDMCEVEQIVRNYRRAAPSYQAYQDCDELGCERTCEKENYWSSVTTPPYYERSCCASRKISVPAFLERPYAEMGSDDDIFLNVTWDPFLAEEFDYRFPSDCDAFTDADADVLNELLYECAPYFEASTENLLNQCTVAAKIVQRSAPNFENEDYIWAFSKVLECGAEIPSKCLRGDGSGMMDTYLSLLPFATTDRLKEGPYPITVVRTMVPVTGRQREHMEWKWELQGRLEKKFYYMNGNKCINGKEKGVALMGFNLGTKRDIFTWYIMHDINYALIAMAVVLMLMWWYTNSLMVTLLAFGEILSSLGLGFFFYSTVLNLPHFPFMNATTLFLAIGIGADDVFVYTDSWRHSLTAVKGEGGQPPSLPDRLAYSLRHAGMSTFVTSFTTSAAFGANIMSRIVSIKCFGVFAALVIMSDYLLMITFLPAIVLNYDEAVCAGELSRNSQLTSGEDSGAGGRGLCQSQFAAVRRYLDNAKSVFDKVFDTVIPSMVLGEFPHITESVHPAPEEKKQSMAQAARSKIVPSLWFILLGGLGLYATDVAFRSPGLTLPLSASYQLFYDEHPFEVWDMKYSPKFTTASVAGVKYKVEWWFGVSGVDDSNPWDPEDPGTIQTYPIDVVSEESQTALLEMTLAIQEAPWFDLKRELFMDDMVRFMARDCGYTNSTGHYILVHDSCCQHQQSEFPFLQQYFHSCLNDWANNNGKGQYSQGLYFNKDGSVGAVKMRVNTNVDFTSSNPKTEEFWNKILAFTDKYLWSKKASLASTGLLKGWPTAQLTLYDVQESLATGVKQTLILSLFIATLVLYITTLSVFVTLLSMSAITCILGWTITVCIWEGWHLSILESIVFSVAVGLSVDFCVHYSWATLLCLRSSGLQPKRTLLMTSLSEMGGSVTMGSGTTVVAGCVMLMCKTLFFLRFGFFLITCMAFSWFYSTFFLHACFAVIPDHWLRFRPELWLAQAAGWKGAERSGQVLAGGEAMAMYVERPAGARGPSTEMTRLRLGSQGSIGSSEVDVSVDERGSEE